MKNSHGNFCCCGKCENNKLHCIVTRNVTDTKSRGKIVFEGSKEKCKARKSNYEHETVNVWIMSVDEY